MEILASLVKLFKFYPRKQKVKSELSCYITQSCDDELWEVLNMGQNKEQSVGTDGPCSHKANGSSQIPSSLSSSSFIVSTGTSRKGN